MMRKYGLDEGTEYVEKNTLLEPNNFIPSWVSKRSISRYLMPYRKLEMKRRKKFQTVSES